MPDEMPAFLPDDWKGGLVAARDRVRAVELPRQHRRRPDRRHHGAARVQGQVHIGYLAAIVAASNAGGSGSVVGDTTTTMMWIDGISPLAVLEAYVAAGAGAPDLRHPAAISSTAIRRSSRSRRAACRSNGHAGHRRRHPDHRDRSPTSSPTCSFPALLDAVPVIGLAVWVVILLTAPLRRPDWEIMPETFKGTIFLLALVTCASMMPVEELPLPRGRPRWASASCPRCSTTSRSPRSP